MKSSVYIILKRSGPTRMTKGKPVLARDEIAVCLRLEVPDSAFLAPLVFADLTVPEHAIMVPEVKIEIEPASAIEARRAETGTGSVHESAGPKGDAPIPEANHER